MRKAGWVMAVLCMLGAIGAAFSAQADSGASREILSGAGDSRLIVIGEMHGTRETPALVAELATRYSQQGPLLLGIEIPRGEHDSLRDYLSSPVAALSNLATRPAWQKPRESNDGRRSSQMLALIEVMRRLRAQGRDVAVLPFDVSRSGNGAEARDHAMADYLRAAYQALPNGRLLVLTGNVHAMQKKPAYCPQCQTPMTSYLHDLAPFSVSVVAERGSSWGCAARCGPVPVAPTHPRGGPTPGGRDDVYSFVAVLPVFTPAELIKVPPAPEGVW